MQYIAISAATINYSEVDCHLPVEDLKNGFISDSTPANQECDAAAIDALARICVSKKEIIAVGVQFNHVEKFLDIVIAGNHNYNDSLGKEKKHLENVLRVVQELGMLYAERDKDGGRNGDVVGSSEKVINTDGHRITRCASELKAVIVNHSAAKLHKSIAERWPAWKHLVRDLLAYTNAKPEGETQFFQNLLQISSFLGHIYNILEPKSGELAKKLEPDEVKRICEHLTSAWEKFRPLQEARKIDVLRCVQSFSQNTQFPLIQYLEEVLSLHASSMELVNWAHSPRLQESLSMQLRVRTLASSSEDPKLPTTEAGWAAVFNDMLKASGVEAEDSPFIAKSASNALLKYKSPSKPKRRPIHCEVALVQHYFLSQSPSVPAYTYIGVSKYSCLPCYLFLRGFAEETGKIFQTKGTHGKIYYPWGFPRLGNKTLEGSLQERLAKGITEHVASQLAKMGKVRLCDHKKRKKKG